MDSSSIKQRNGSSSGASVSTADEKNTSISTDQPAESLETQQKAKARAEKAEAIRQACDTRDIERLISYATTEGGLLDDELRQRACMFN
jgi:non-canonical (house-cleaning) NTP pyrophosphatase